MLNNFFFLENRAPYETMWKNIVEWGRPRMTIWPMRIVCGKTKAVDTHSEFEILIAFPLQL
jgi:hypothetical protein